MENFREQAMSFLREQKISDLSTISDEMPWARPMSHFRIDDDFTMYYCTYAASNKIQHIKVNKKVCVVASSMSKDIRIFGEAEIITDKAEKEKYWYDDWKAFFPQGKTDPGYVIVKVHPIKVQYRDSAKTGHESVEVQ